MAGRRTFDTSRISPIIALLVVTLLGCDQGGGGVDQDDGDGDGFDSWEDCDDADPDINPAAPEVCDGIDNDCDGDVDEEDVAHAPVWFADADDDGFGDPRSRSAACSAPEGTVADGADCDDGDASINPAGIEVCNGRDDDCDGEIDEDDAEDAPTWYADADGDGAGDPEARIDACVCPAGYVATDDDCDDARDDVHPDASELCDGADNDCDGETDEGIPTWSGDVDGDGYGDPEDQVESCERPEGYVADATDCDDADAAVNPSATEVCDGIDNDCDGSIDGDDVIEAPTWYPDADGDGYGDPGAALESCDAPEGTIADGSDCDDSAPGINPSATEMCDGIDNDCDGHVDGAGAADAGEWFRDADGDGNGDPAVMVRACESPDGFVAVAEDCDDSDPEVHPDAAETWFDDIDSDCDGRLDPDPCVSPPPATTVDVDETCELPDLSLVTYGLCQPGCGEDVTVLVQVANTGSAATEVDTSLVVYGRTSAGALFELARSVVVAPLGSGVLSGAFSLVLELDRLRPCNSLVIRVDDDETVTECDETDDEATLHLTGICWTAPGG
jgi:hypothetical protein